MHRFRFVVAGESGGCDEGCDIELVWWVLWVGGVFPLEWAVVRMVLARLFGSSDLLFRGKKRYGDNIVISDREEKDYLYFRFNQSYFIEIIHYFISIVT